MDDPDIWQWIWLVAAATFFLGEMTSPGTFFLLPFAVGAGVAAILALFDVPVTAQWVAFVGISLGSFLAMRPLAKRLNSQGHVDGIGAKRLVGARGVVLDDIPGADGLGLVLVDREQWRAQSSTGSPLTEGTQIHVIDVKGTRVLVSTAPPPPKLTD